MPTILEIKLDNEDKIRTAVGAGSITKIIDADMRDEVADELRIRGVIQVANAAALASQSHANSKLVLVTGVGLFMELETAAAADNLTTFASADAGWLWTKVADVLNQTGEQITITGDYVYTLKDGLSIDMIKIKPDNADDGKAGFTNGGEEIMFLRTFTAGEWYTLRVDIDADGSDKLIYLNGFTADTILIIYKRKI